MNRSSRGSNNTGVVQVLSLFILLLAFFVLLFNISKVERFRANTVSSSLRSSFASEGKPSTMPHALTSADGQFLEVEAFSREIGRLIKKALPVVQYETSNEGRLIVARFPFATVFSSETIEVTDGAIELIDDLTDAFKKMPPGLRVSLESVISVPEGSVPLSGSGGSNLWVARAGSLARAFDDFGQGAASIASGVKLGTDSSVRMTFRLRAAREASLGIAPTEPIR